MKFISEMILGMLRLSAASLSENKSERRAFVVTRTRIFPRLRRASIDEAITNFSISKVDDTIYNKNLARLSSALPLHFPFRRNSSATHLPSLVLHVEAVVSMESRTQKQAH